MTGCVPNNFSLKILFKINIQTRKKFNNVEIYPGKETIYTIPTPGLANIVLPSKGYGGLYEKNGDNLDQIYYFKGDKANYRLTLLPGNYKVVFRAIAAKGYIYTREKSFKIN